MKVKVTEVCGRVAGYEMDELPECLVFQEGESLIGCKPVILLQLQPEEAASLICGRLRGEWVMGLEIIRGMTGVEVKVQSAHRLKTSEERTVLHDRLIVDHSFSQQLITGFQNFSLSREGLSLCDIGLQLQLAERAIDRTERRHENLVNLFGKVQSELKEARARVKHTRELLLRFSQQ
ncbi:hypothetical protein R1sor_019393 [Riccia sorocarpa]|uniref:Uncharacterized protein n=1 Tax=Riccia sorocarpa TaxID=122646 RepID=A0ABD3IDH3_9MARC